MYHYCVFSGGSDDLEQELLLDNTPHKFNIPIIALPDGDEEVFDSKGTRICVIPPTPLPPNYDPYDNYYT
ncbi:hypothetical protein EB796_016379 [Bugula neritina]|uniref:Uncharacterized protein n=1 Tax=Bugula neritina TaxID=10212 RepID=A0A7J7JI76_BUGNE|nr:hypothetical protein EB796_016379 [Bugula neritina]